MYNSMPYEEVGKGVKYIGKVEINGHSYVSNPIFNTTNEAEEAAAKNAYNELKDLQKFGPPIDLNDQQAIDNLFDKIIQVKSAFITIKLLEIHFAMSLLKIYNNFKLQIVGQGTWFSEGIEKEFGKRYANERLPNNWLNLVMNSNGKLQVEE